MTEIPNDLTKLNRDALRKLAKELDIPGRGDMLKTELIEAITAARKPAKRIPVTPLSKGQRTDNYLRQSGRLTSRQVRRIKHKANRAMSQGRAS